MSATARIALRASLRPQISARVATNVSRSRLASTHAQSTSTKSGWTPMVSAMIAGGVAIGSLAYMQSPLRMESHAEKSQRKSYYERMQSKGQVGGGASSGKGQDAGGAGGQNESKSKSDQKTSSRGDTTEEKAEDSAQRRSEAAEGDKQQQQDDARQSVAESSTLPLDELESEASQESAFDPETNTINWDCPCLGGMAHGPCGDEFKEAFSCFVFSEKEPKGIECVEKFKGMQDCFRKYPEHYKEELEDDEEYEKHDGETLERKGEEHFASHAGGDQEEDDGLKEWRSELAKEGTN